jgi:hypothetical protein
MDSATILAVAGTAVTGTAILAATALVGFKQWIALKQAELTTGQSAPGVGLPQTAARIDLADIKERIRKLEAIAAGVEL